MKHGYHFQIHTLKHLIECEVFGIVVVEESAAVIYSEIDAV